MKTHIRYILICLFSLSPIISGAETGTIPHDFDAMFNASPKKLEVTNSNKTGTSTEDGIVYTCTGSKAEIFLDLFNPEGSKKMAINLKESGNFVTTTVVSSLQSVVISCGSQKEKSYIKVYISTDGINWREPDNISYSTYITATFAAGDYYVKILNSASSNNVSIFEIRYTYIDLSGCPNCFIYKP